MIYRTVVRVGGPPASGKTTLVEALLRSIDLDVICMRAVRDESIRQPEESRPRAHPELRRFRSAGASGVTLYRFPKVDTEAFFESDFMTNWSEAVLIEGEPPLNSADLAVFVMRPPASGPGLLQQVKRSHAAERERSLAAMERALNSPESMAFLLLGGFGDKAVELALNDLGKLERVRDQMATQIAKMRHAKPPAPTKHWVVRADYRGVERAQVVVVNIHGETEQSQGERLVEEVRRLRTDKAVFQDVFAHSGSRVPITALVADLSDPGHPGLRKALARIKRTLRSTD
jgi:molybdopterin-guanine dinucleotide biosynthesis protein